MAYTQGNPGYFSSNEEFRAAMRQLYRDFAAYRRREWLNIQRIRQQELAARAAAYAAARNRRREFIRGRGRGRN